VTVAERSTAPLAGALGAAAGAVAARWHRDHCLDLRCNVTVIPACAKPWCRCKKTGPTPSAATQRSRHCCTTRGSALTNAKSSRSAAAMSASGRFDNPPSIFRDPPDHDRLRRLVMRRFTPERIAGMRQRVVALVGGLLDAHRGRGQIDIVDSLAYPLPVTVICELLGVPREDEPRFHDWASEVLRFDPPVQFRTRITLADLQAAGITITQGATVALLLASGSRDPRRFPNADQFIPDRTDNQHFGFGGGIHYCVGAPLARIEAPIALRELAWRLATPRLLEDPPPYWENAALARATPPAGHLSTGSPAKSFTAGRPPGCSQISPRQR
jgi:cytochrome P450